MDRPVSSLVSEHWPTQNDLRFPVFAKIKTLRPMVAWIMCTLAPSVDSRSIVGRQSTDPSTDCRPTINRLSTDCRPTVGLYFLTDSRPTVGAEDDCRSPVGRLSADWRPTACQWGRLRVMILARKGANSESYFMWGWEKCIVYKKESSWWNIRSRWVFQLEWQKLETKTPV